MSFQRRVGLIFLVSAEISFSFTSYLLFEMGDVVEYSVFAAYRVRLWTDSDASSRFGTDRRELNQSNVSNGRCLRIF
jgi:hypothetical protein